MSLTRDDIAEINPEALLCDGFDAAIIGMAERINFGPVVAYDRNKIIEILAKDMEVSEDELSKEDKENGMTLEDLKILMAIEHFEFNIQGSYVGEFTPVFIVTSIEY